MPNGSATIKAIEYILKRCAALIRCCEDGAVPIDNNRIENQIRPLALASYYRINGLRVRKGDDLI